MHQFPIPFRGIAGRLAKTAALAAACAGAVALAGCASRAPVPAQSSTLPLPLPRWSHVATHVPGGPRQDALLAVQAEGPNATRWSLFDPLGMPLARQILQDGEWRNDGFLPPNPGASTLFSAILFAWWPANGLDAAYPDQAWREQTRSDGSRIRTLAVDGETRWTVEWSSAAPDDTFAIRQADGTSWRVAPVKEKP